MKTKEKEPIGVWIDSKVVPQKREIRFAIKSYLSLGFGCSRFFSLRIEFFLSFFHIFLVFCCGEDLGLIGNWQFRAPASD